MARTTIARGAAHPSNTDGSTLAILTAHEMLRAPVSRVADRADWTPNSHEVFTRVDRNRHQPPASAGFQCVGYWAARPDPPTPDRRVARPDVRIHLAFEIPRVLDARGELPFAFPFWGVILMGWMPGWRPSSSPSPRVAGSREDPVRQGSHLAGWLVVVSGGLGGTAALWLGAVLFTQLSVARACSCPRSQWICSSDSLSPSCCSS